MTVPAAVLLDGEAEKLDAFAEHDGPKSVLVRVHPPHGQPEREARKTPAGFDHWLYNGKEYIRDDNLKAAILAAAREAWEKRRVRLMRDHGPLTPDTYVATLTCERVVECVRVPKMQEFAPQCDVLTDGSFAVVLEVMK